MVRFTKIDCFDNRIRNRIKEINFSISNIMTKQTKKFKIGNKNTTKQVSLTFYYRNVISYLLLEELFDGRYHVYDEVEKSIFRLIPQYFYFNATAWDFGQLYLFLYKMNFIEIKNDKEKNNLLMRLTEDGKIALKTQIFENMASSCFFNYNTVKISRNSLYISLIAILLTLITSVVTLNISNKPHSINQKQIDELRLELQSIKNAIVQKGN